MATAKRRASIPLADRLRQNGHAFNFYQAIRLALRLHPDRVPVGHLGPPNKEAVRLYGVHELVSPEASVASIQSEAPYPRQEPSAVPLHLRTPSGLSDAYNPCALPNVYTEEIRKALDLHQNPCLAEFIDLFNHRLLSLEYRAWEKSRFYVRYEREPLRERSRLMLTYWVYSFMGLGTSGFTERLHFPDRWLLQYAGFLLPISRPAESLKRLVQSFFGVNTEVDQFQGKWCTVSLRDRASLGSRGSRLEEGPVLGDKTWYQQATLRVRLGPLSLGEFRSFLPGRRRFGQLVEFLNHYTRRNFNQIEVELVLKAEHVPPCRLRALGEPLAVLGCLAWLGSRGVSRSREPVAVVFRSTEPRALLRVLVEVSLRSIRERLRTGTQVQMSWTEAVVGSLMRSCPNAREERMHVEAVVKDLVERRIRGLLQDRSELPGSIQVQMRNNEIAFEVQ